MTQHVLVTAGASGIGRESGLLGFDAVGFTRLHDDELASRPSGGSDE